MSETLHNPVCDRCKDTGICTSVYIVGVAYTHYPCPRGCPIPPREKTEATDGS